LQNLTPQEELSVFLASRGGVLSHVNGDFANSLIAYAYSARLRPNSAQSTARVNAASEELYKKIINAHPEAYRQMAARIAAQDTAKPVAMPSPDGAAVSGGNAPWWRSEAGRAANMAEVQRMNEENRRNMERMQSAVPQPNGAPIPGIPSKPQVSGQPNR
jgi:hypothetical protein